jgi:hypothetical protein
MASAAAAAAAAPPPLPSGPVVTQLQTAWDRHFPHSASTTHPVFFTDRLRRSAVTVPAGALNSPVAHGYIYQDATRLRDGAPKL